MTVEKTEGPKKANAYGRIEGETKNTETGQENEGKTKNNRDKTKKSRP